MAKFWIKKITHKLKIAKSIPISLRYLLTLYLILPLVDTLVISIIISELYLIMFLIWILWVFLLKIPAHFTLSLSSAYLVFSLMYISLDETFSANRFSVWFYLFLVLGVIQLITRDEKHQLSLAAKPSLVSIFVSVILDIYQSPVLFSISMLSGFIYYLSLIIWQARYYYWFYSFQKLNHYMSDTVTFQLLILSFFCVLFLIFIYRWPKRFQLIITMYLITILVVTHGSFRYTAKDIIIHSNEPKIAQFREYNGILYLHGHNFGPVMNEISMVYIDDQPQQIITWQNELLSVALPDNFSHNGQIWLVNHLDQTSNKLWLN